VRYLRVPEVLLRPAAQAPATPAIEEHAMTNEEWFADMEDGLRESWREVYGRDPEPEEVQAIMDGIREATR
jgi:hypothetical protein